jgi:hypothetical protein
MMDPNKRTTGHPGPLADPDRLPDDMDQDEASEDEHDARERSDDGDKLELEGAASIQRPPADS